MGLAFSRRIGLYYSLRHFTELSLGEGRVGSRLLPDLKCLSSIVIGWAVAAVAVEPFFDHAGCDRLARNAEASLGEILLAIQAAASWRDIPVAC
jgi:hypothetical protein